MEQFSFRANGREVLDEAVIDPDEPFTQVAASVVTALQLDRSETTDLIAERVIGTGERAYSCVVAWTIYEAHGYRSLLSVTSRAGSTRNVIGSDFLGPHQLHVDDRHSGLVGFAPPNAEPLTGGGYVLDASRSDVLELNRMRFEAAQPGEMLRPHPAWRFTIPTGVKAAQVPPEPLADAPRNRAIATGTDPQVLSGSNGRSVTKRICQWRGPVSIPLATLIASLGDAIATAARYTRVDPTCRLHGWRRALEGLALQDRRVVATQMVRGIQSRLARTRAVGESSDDNALTALWDFPYRDAYRSLVEARMFVQVVTRLSPQLRPSDWAKLVSGTLRPEGERGNTPHRDFLLEFYVAAVADAAGMRIELAQGADPTANPDVIVKVDGERVGIAAKRLRSRNKVFKNAKKAADQIAAACVDRGLVFLDVSNVMNRDAAAIRYLQPPEVIQVPGSGTVLGHLLRFGADHPELERLLERPHVEGIILRHAVPAMLAKTFVPAALETWSPVVDQPSALTTKMLGRLLGALAPSSSEPTIGPPGYAPCEVTYVHP